MGHMLYLSSMSPTPAEMIMSLYDKNYKREDYVADIIQFLSCNKIIKFLQSEVEKYNSLYF
jgi:hypothetical protein